MSVLGGLLGTWPGRALIGALVAVVVGAPILVGRITAAPPAAEARTAPVARGSVTQAVAVSGSVNAGGTVRMNFQTTGRVTEILVKVGDRVTSGQVLARLDTASLEASLAQAQANLASAQARYEQTAAGALPEDVAIARQAVDNAARSLESTKRTAENDVASATLARVNAQRSLEQAKRAAQSDVASAQVSLSKAQVVYATAKSTLSSLTAAIKTDLAGFQSGLATLQSSAQGAVRDIQTSVNQTADVVSARNSVLAAEGTLATARMYAGVPLQSALDEYVSARDALLAATTAYDAASAAGAEPTSALQAYQNALVGYNGAAAKLMTALDAPAGQLAPAQALVTSAQSKLNDPTVWIYADLAAARNDLANLQVALVTEQQRVAALRSKATQAGTAVTAITNAVSSDLANAQQALASSQDKTTTSVQNAQTALANAEQSLASTQIRSDSSVSSAQNALENARLSLAKTAGAPKAPDVASAYASVLSAQVLADQAQLNLASATMRAPTAGVIATLTGQVGENATGTATSPFISVANVTTLALHGTIGEADVAKLKLGQVATVTVDAVGAGSRMTGKVTLIDPVATIQQGVPVYGVDVTVDVPDPQVRPGMSGTANVILASRTNVLTVPNLAIRTTAGRRGVQVMRDGKAVDAEVVFGIATDSVTEVVSGLEEGELVVLPQARTTTPAQQQRPLPGVPGGGAQFR